jgi:hypothetical protein
MGTGRAYRVVTFSDGGPGVYGESATWLGVWGKSNKNAGVFGESKGFDGVVGESDADQRSGVVGRNTIKADASTLRPRGGNGVWGESFSEGYSGVAGVNVQLDFDINSIVAAVAHTLRGVYTNLTKDPVDPFPDFKQVLDDAFPPTNPNGTPRISTIPGSNPDNPFPLPTPRSLSVTRYTGALAPNERTNSIRTLINKGGKHTLRPTLNANRRAALL